MAKEASERGNFIYPLSRPMPDWCISTTHTPGLSSEDQFSDSLELEMPVDTWEKVMEPSKKSFPFIDYCLTKGFPGSSNGKESTCNEGDLSSVPGLGRSPGGGHGNPLQCSCLENPQGQRSLVGSSLWGCKESSTNVFSVFVMHVVMFWHFSVCS